MMSDNVNVSARRWDYKSIDTPRVVKSRSDIHIVRIGRCGKIPRTWK